MNTNKVSDKEYLKSIILIAIIVVVIVGCFLGLRFALNTDVPVRVVESGSMCVSYDGACDGWGHIFEHTLHVGDIIVIQNIDPRDINTNYPNSDIIVYQNPTNPNATPIVHRVITSYEIDGVLYFQTKGDGNPSVRWPDTPSTHDYDSNSLWHTGSGVPQDLVIGKVIMRIPWFGHITLFMRNTPWVLPVLVALIVGLLLIEFILPYTKKKKQEPLQANPDGAIDTSFQLVKRILSRV